MGTLGIIIAVLIAGGLGYVRLAPLNAQRWHQPVAQSEDTDLSGGAVRVIAGDSETLAQIDTILRGFDRTDVLAGAVDAGRITYVTRSAVFGFPDLTTVELQGSQIRMFARLRFGASDLGVNRERLERVIAALQRG